MLLVNNSIISRAAVSLSGGIIGGANTLPLATPMPLVFIFCLSTHVSSTSVTESVMLPSHMYISYRAPSHTLYYVCSMGVMIIDISGG